MVAIRIMTRAPRWLFCATLPLAVLAGSSAQPQVGTEPAPQAESHRFAGPDGAPLPLETDDEILDFLRTAEVADSSEIPTGINNPLKLLLRRDGIEMHAVFRSVDHHRNDYQTNEGRVVLKFHDSHKYEVAAYELSRLLGIAAVPPATPRKLRETGSLQVWIEGAMTETIRREEKIKVPGSLRWVRQWQVMRVFDVLIDNYDRNIGNVLIDSDWNVWLVDHTRSFSIHRKLHRPERVFLCERRLWQGLQALDETAVRERLGAFLSEPQITALLKRRLLLIEHVNKLIAKKSESAVLYDLQPAHPPG